MRHVGCLSVVVFALVAACPAQAEPQAEQPSIEALMKKIDALQRRLDEVEGRQRAAKSSSARVTHRSAPTLWYPLLRRRRGPLQCSRPPGQFPACFLRSRWAHNLKTRYVRTCRAFLFEFPARKAKCGSTVLQRLRATTTSVLAIKITRRRRRRFHLPAVRLPFRAVIWG